MRDVRGRSAFAAAFVTLSLVTIVMPARADEPRVEVPEGFRATTWLELDPSAPFERQLGGLAWTREGDPVVYENAEIRVHKPDGIERLHRFEPPVFGSFVAVTPDGERVFFAESTHGTLRSISVDGGPMVMLATVPQAYDLAFAPEGAPEALRGAAFISAPGTSTESNSIWVLRSGSEPVIDEVVSGIPTFSGPIAFDPEGNLYTITSSFDPPPALLRFTPESLDKGIGAGTIDVSEGEVILPNVDGAFDLVWIDGRLYASNLGFARGEGTIDVYDPAEGFFPHPFARIVFDEGVLSPTWIAFHPGAGFEPGAGRDGGRLLVALSDFSTESRVVEIAPELWFIRGEVNGDGEVDLSDAIFLLQYLFAAGDRPEVIEAADVNATGSLDISDSVYLLGYLFRGGPAPPAPFPERGPAS